MEEVQTLIRPDTLVDSERCAPALSTDVVIIGGGLAGSLAGAMLGRAGIDCVVVDPHTEYPPDFRCEKLDGDQVARLQKTGLADEVLSAATFDGEAWVARMGVVVDKRPGRSARYFLCLAGQSHAVVDPVEGPLLLCDGEAPDN